MSEFKFHWRRSTLSRARPYKCNLTYFYVNFFIFGTFWEDRWWAGAMKNIPWTKGMKYYKQSCSRHNLRNMGLASSKKFGDWSWWTTSKSCRCESGWQVQRHNMYIVHHQIEECHLVWICTNHSGERDMQRCYMALLGRGERRHWGLF